MYCCDHQQIIDTVIKAFALAEAVSIPVMVCYDGYLLSHTYMPFEVPDEKKVAEFLPPFKPAYALDPAEPGQPQHRDPARRARRHQRRDGPRLHGDPLPAAGRPARRPRRSPRSTRTSFKKLFGRGGDALLEPYRCDDAEHIVVGLGSLTYQLRDVVETLRAEGLKVGVLGVRLYRPFPDEAVAAGPAGARRVIVLEKAVSYGYEGALCSDVKAALYGAATERAVPVVRGLIAGIGGRDIRTADLADTLRAAHQRRRCRRSRLDRSQAM